MKEFLKFLFVGPLILILQELRLMRRENMTTQQELVTQLNELGAQLDSTKTELASDLDRLLKAVADNAVPAPVVDAVNSLAAKIQSLASLDVPNPVDETETPPETVPDDSDAPGEAEPETGEGEADSETFE